MKKKTETPQKRYNSKRVRLCEFSVTQGAAKEIKPALEYIESHHGSKVAALSAAVLREYKRLKKLDK